MSWEALRVALRVAGMRYIVLQTNTQHRQAMRGPVLSEITHHVPAVDRSGQPWFVDPMAVKADICLTDCCEMFDQVRHYDSPSPAGIVAPPALCQSASKCAITHSLDGSLKRKT